MADLPPPISHLGRYDILRVLGQGAMGVVYEGRDPNLDRRVAIKTVRVVGMAASEIAEYEQRFKTEARSAGRLQHPNIVSVYDSDKHVDATGQTAYIVMEFVQGEDLKHFLDHGKRFSLEQTAYMMADLLAALDYAHKHKIIHRDIKPANMLLTKEGRIKLTDFGVARITDSGEATKTSGGTVGTLKYMSPEQVAGKGVDSSSDIFSAGIVLYQLLTGLRPFDGEGYLDIVSKIVKEDPTPPSQIVGALPPSLDSVVAKALAKSKLDRFADAASFAAALKAAVNNADLTITPSARPRPEVSEGLGTFPGSITGTAGSTVTQELELVYWKDIKESNEPEVLEGFLKRFPVGIYADLAKRRLKTLADAEKTAGASSRYEATQLRKPGEATLVQNAASGLATQGVVGTVVATGASQDDPTLPPSAYNDSEYGPNTQFAATQFPQNEAENPGQSAEQAKEGAQANKAMPLETVPDQLPLKQKKKKSSPPWALIGMASLGVFAGLVWLLRSPAAPPNALSPVASEVTPTASISASNNPTATQASGTSMTASSSAVVAGSPTSVAASAPNQATPMPATAASAPLSAASAAARALAAARAASAAAAAKANPPNRRASAPEPIRTTPATPEIPAAQPAPAQRPAQTTVTPTSPSPAPSPAPAPTTASGPREACADRVLLSFQFCMSEQCQKPIFRNHPICVERREMEERRRNQSSN